MVLRKNRPVNPNIVDGSYKSCSKCDYAYPIGEYAKSHTGRRMLRCNKCIEKDTFKKESNKGDGVKINYECEKFDLGEIKKALLLNNGQKTGTTIGIFGQSKYSGKTTLLKRIVDICKNDYDYIVLFAGNTEANIYDDLRKLDNFKICHKFHELIVGCFYNINDETDKNKRLNVLFILDDDISHKNNAILKEMVISYRNMNISTIICSQSYAIVNKDNRSNFNHVFLGKFLSGKPIDDLTDIYLEPSVFDELKNLSGTKQKQALRDFYRLNTENYNFINVFSGDTKISYKKCRVD